MSSLGILFVLILPSYHIVWKTQESRKREYQSLYKSHKVAETGCLLMFIHFPPSSKVLSSDFAWVSYPSLHSLEDDPVPTSRGD